MLLEFHLKLFVVCFQLTILGLGLLKNVSCLQKLNGLEQKRGQITTVILLETVDNGQCSCSVRIDLLSSTTEQDSCGGQLLILLVTPLSSLMSTPMVISTTPLLLAVAGFTSLTQSKIRSIRVLCNTEGRYFAKAVR